MCDKEPEPPVPDNAMPSDPRDGRESDPQFGIPGDGIAAAAPLRKPMFFARRSLCDSSVA